MFEIFGILKKNSNFLLQSNIASAVELFCENKQSFDIITDDRFAIYISSNSNKKAIFTKTNFFHYGYGGTILNKNLHRFEHEPDIASFIGKFLFVYFNSQTKVLKLINDRLGCFPVFYYESDEYLCFASNLKYLLAVNNINIALDKLSITEYFYWGQTWPGTTFFKNIKILPPSTCITCSSDGKVNFTSYSYSELNYKTNNLKDATKLFSNILSSILDDYANYYGKLYISLTGGLDSRIIAGHLNKNIDADFFTLEHPTIDNNVNSEITIARKLAKTFNRPHRVVKSIYFPVSQNFNYKYFEEIKPLDNVNPVVLGIFGNEINRLLGVSIIHRHLADVFFKANEKFDYSYSFYNCCTTLQLSESINNPSFCFFKELFNTNFAHDLFYETVEQRLLQAKAQVEINPFAFLTLLLCSPYYNCFHGGSMSSHVSNNYFCSNTLLPFIDERLIAFADSNTMEYLGLHNNSIYMRLFQKKLKKLRKIPTNSIMKSQFHKFFNIESKHVDCSQKPITNFKQNLELALNSNYIEHLNIFDNNKIKNAAINNQAIAASYTDFYVWLTYYNNKFKIVV